MRFEVLEQRRLPCEHSQMRWSKSHSYFLKTKNPKLLVSQLTQFQLPIADNSLGAKMFYFYWWLSCTHAGAPLLFCSGVRGEGGQQFLGQRHRSLGPL